jgi:hypothetical protein
MTSQELALIDVLAQIHDPRQSSGKRYSLVAILAVAVAAMLCGYRSYSAIAEWRRHYGQQLAEALGFKDGKSPCAATFFNIFSRLDKQAVEQKLGTWAASLQSSSQQEDECEALAIDGKTLRGSKKQGAPAAHLLSALGHRLGLTLLEVAQTILDQGGDYLMLVKGNQPGLLAQVEGAIAGVDFYTQEPQTAETLDYGHGRIEQRQIITTSVPADCCVWPGLDQAFKIDRRIVEQKSGKERIEEVYGITSLSRERAGAVMVQAINRDHWSIGNQSHWVRDVTFDEDRSEVRKGSIPQVMAALRNTAIGLLRWSGESNIAAACRRFAAQPWAALALLGINLST